MRSNKPRADLVVPKQTLRTRIPSHRGVKSESRASSSGRDPEEMLFYRTNSALLFENAEILKLGKAEKEGKIRGKVGNAELKSANITAKVLRTA